MNTVQSYTGKGDSISSDPQKGQNAAQAPFSLDERRVRIAQTRLLKIVDQFYAEHAGSGPIEAINDLLYKWLTTPSIDLSSQVNQNQLFTVFALVNFLAELSESAIQIELIREEVSNE